MNAAPTAPPVEAGHDEQGQPPGQNQEPDQAGTGLPGRQNSQGKSAGLAYQVILSFSLRYLASPIPWTFFRSSPD